MPVKLTKRTVDALRAKSIHDHVFDSALVGFGVRVMPSGVKQFFIQYKPPAGRAGERRRLTIGRYGTMTVDQARIEARRLLALVTQGRDPAAERAARRGAPTVGEVAPKFLELVHAKRKPTTASEYARQLNKHILPALSSKRIAEVTRPDVAALHLALRDRPYLANRVLALCGAFFHWAEEQDFRPAYSNPTRHVEPYPEHRRERYLTPSEFKALGAALETAGSIGLPPAPSRRRKAPPPGKIKHTPKAAGNPIPANPYALALLRFLMLSGWREGEARLLKWDEINLERGFATLGDTKTGRSVRQLGAPAVELLAELPRLQGCPYVFPGATAAKPIVNITRLWESVRHAAGLDDLRIHDLRHAFASVAASGGLSLPLVGALLGHRNASTTQRYAHLGADPAKIAADRVANDVNAMLRATAKRERRAATGTRQAKSLAPAVRPPRAARPETP